VAVIAKKLYHAHQRSFFLSRRVKRKKLRYLSEKIGLKPIKFYCIVIVNYDDVKEI